MFRNEIVLLKNSYKPMGNKLSVSNDILLYYGTSDAIRNKLRKPYKKPIEQSSSIGTIIGEMKGTQEAADRYKLGAEINNIWHYDWGAKKEYPTQKPYKLLERIICLSTL